MTTVPNVRLRSRAFPARWYLIDYASTSGNEVRVSSRSEQELYEAASRYESEVTNLGKRFADEVERAIHLLLEHAELGDGNESLRESTCWFFILGGGDGCRSQSSGSTER
jgi:hypothetical protein